MNSEGIDEVEELKEAQLLNEWYNESLTDKNKK